MIWQSTGILESGLQGKQEREPSTSTSSNSTMVATCARQLLGWMHPPDCPTLSWMDFKLLTHFCREILFLLVPRLDTTKPIQLRPLHASAFSPHRITKKSQRSLKLIHPMMGLMERRMRTEVVAMTMGQAPRTAQRHIDLRAMTYQQIICKSCIWSCSLHNSITWKESLESTEEGTGAQRKWQVKGLSSNYGIVMITSKEADMMVWFTM